jgi:hypothetical protein
VCSALVVRLAATEERTARPSDTDLPELPENRHMLNTGHVAPPFRARSRARSLERWRQAATLVGVRWRVFLEAEPPPPSRAWAFASHVAALDAEEAAAAEMAARPSGLAA